MGTHKAPYVLPERILRVIYYILGILMVAVYGIRRDIYHLSISLGTLIVPPAIDIAHRILRLKPSHRLNFIILLFTFIAYFRETHWIYSRKEQLPIC